MQKRASPPTATPPPRPAALLKAARRPHASSGLRFPQSESKLAHFVKRSDFFLMLPCAPFSHHLCYLSPPSLDPSDSTIQLICVAKATGLGLVIKGGANRADGPMVFIQELMPGGDCQKVVFSTPETPEFYQELDQTLQILVSDICCSRTAGCRLETSWCPSTRSL